MNSLQYEQDLVSQINHNTNKCDKVLSASARDILFYFSSSHACLPFGLSLCAYES